ncbi:MAG: hypothetical protein WA959_10535 [Rivularia sp. (in: cyanobacteria)]
MSQENKNIKPPSSPEKLPFWKALLVKALRGTIGILENTAENLETEPIPGSEEKPGFLQKIQQIWIGILGKIRLIIPAQFSAKLSDTALTGILGGLVVMVFLITSNVFDRKPSEVANVPPNTEIPQVVSTTEPDIVSEAEIPPVIEKTPLPTEEETKSQPENEIPPVIEKTPLPTEEIGSKPDETPEKEELEIIPPPIPLTPEETLIAAIQNQVGEISLNLKDSSSENPTFAEIIESIQANFLNSNLTIKINNDWYRLEKKQQNKLAAKILQRSQELDFTHLEITDLEGKLIARNPVVGTEMIIFKR